MNAGEIGALLIAIAALAWLLHRARGGGDRSHGGGCGDCGTKGGSATLHGRTARSHAPDRGGRGAASMARSDPPHAPLRRDP